MKDNYDRLVKQKLTRMSSYIDELEPYLQCSGDEYLSSSGRRRVVERLTQVIVESATDVNNLLTEQAGQAPAMTAPQSFVTVHDLGAINEHLLDRFQRYVGLRNRIVHDYNVLDNRIVYYSAKRLIDDARKYAESIYRYLSLGSAEGDENK